MKDTITIELEVSRDELGQISSHHSFRTPEDEDLSKTWQGGGIAQIAYAFLVEAARREAFVSSLILQTSNPNFFSEYASGTEEQKAEIEESLKESIQKIMGKTIGMVGAGVAKEVLMMTTNQL